MNFLEFKSTFSEFYGSENVDFQLGDSTTEVDVIIKFDDFTVTDSKQRTINIRGFYTKMVFRFSNEGAWLTDLSDDEHNKALTLKQLSRIYGTRTIIDGHEHKWGGFHPHLSSGFGWQSLCKGSQFTKSIANLSFRFDETSLFQFLFMYDTFLRNQNDVDGVPYRYIKRLIERRDSESNENGFPRFKDITHFSHVELDFELIESDIVSDSPLTLIRNLNKGLPWSDKNPNGVRLDVHSDAIQNDWYNKNVIKKVYRKVTTSKNDVIPVDEIYNYYKNIRLEDCISIDVDFSNNTPRLKIIDSEKLATALVISKAIKSLEYDLIKDRVINPFNSQLSIAISPSTGVSPEPPYNNPHVFQFKGEPMRLICEKFVHPSTKIYNESKEKKTTVIEVPKFDLTEEYKQLLIDQFGIYVFKTNPYLIPQSRYFT